MKPKIRIQLLSLFCGLFLLACGGGGGGDAPPTAVTPPTQPPPAANAVEVWSATPMTDSALIFLSEKEPSAQGFYYPHESNIKAGGTLRGLHQPRL